MTWNFYYLSLAVIFSINICGSLSVFVWDKYTYKIRLSGYQNVGVGFGFFLERSWSSMKIIFWHLLMPAMPSTLILNASSLAKSTIQFGQLCYYS